ncbi:hypothetical protein GH714_018497 [Hevea brasiliensis]|uniref:Uncharacterized protein n=1 Tax=Hevea brasiliensis TaxID=3981 RepID=A0A6A6LPT7_HEVBR|nr:hypothetical protein GH714_018497 [Hevea brasiliensis]
MGIDPVTHSPRLDLLDLSSILSSSLYNSSQMNISRLLGVQPMFHPELLRLATSIISSQRENQNFVSQNSQENRLCNLQDQNQYQYQPIVQANQFQSPVQEMPTCSALTTPFVPFSNETQLMDANITDLSSQNSQMNHQEWQSDDGMASNLTDYMTQLPSYNNYYASDQTAIMDPSSETTSTFISNNSNQNFSFASVLSTPSSSPTPCINGSSSTEDERESYCSNMLKFEVPYILDVIDPDRQSELRLPSRRQESEHVEYSLPRLSGYERLCFWDSLALSMRKLSLDQVGDSFCSRARLGSFCRTRASSPVMEDMQWFRAVGLLVF